ncbi:MAG: outer membrane beta-barrel protein [Candidatus Kapaibacterium sp.]
MKQLFLIVFIYIACAQVTTVFAQNSIIDSTGKKTLEWTLMLSGGLNFNQHQANFTGMPGVPSCCPQYSDGSGNAPSFGAAFSLPVGRSLLAEMHIGLEMLNGTMTAQQTQIIDNNGVATGLFEHKIDTRISMLTFEPMAKYLLWNSLAVHGGLSIGTLLRATYSQSETLLAPSDITFENDSRVRNKRDGTIAQTSTLQAGLTAGLSYDFPINAEGSLAVTPQLFYTFGLTNIISTNDTWKINSLRAALGITYSFLKAPPKPSDLPLESPQQQPHIPTKR